MRQKQNVQHTLTPIDDTKSYPEPAFRQATGWGRAALRAAREQGLLVAKIAGRNYILGKHFNDFLARLAADQNGGGK